MQISMIAAMAKGRVIGKNNAMPWHLPADFAWFKQNTLNKPIIMGRKTYDSIGRALPGRRNIVLTRNADWSALGVETVKSIDEALRLLEGVQEVVIIGGGSIYQECLPRATRLYLTHIDLDVDGDTYFPEWGEGWTVSYSEEHSIDEKNKYKMDFIILER